ncbi:unnamed protein product [Rotaria socialis]|nr:unnamed protein product [Rotaria socialis]CAF4257167.1 unnamed protein product [Rotaria socialis]
MNHNGEYDSPVVSNPYLQQTPMPNRNHSNEQMTNKRQRSNMSPPGQQQTETHRQLEPTQQIMTHPTTNSKISFPPIVVKFNSDQRASIKEITDDLISSWKNQHGIGLIITARFGHMHSLLIFADDSSTFESLLDPSRWPKTLKDVDIEVKTPRQLPPAYSLIVQQFHRNWNEDEWLTELQQHYVSLYRITRMRVKEGSPLNAVRADFKSIDEVKTLVRSGKINIGSMIHPVKPYHLPIRINKCLKCLRHDHSTKTCSLPRLCPRCAEAHSLENGCPNHERCINCGGNDHMSSNSACPIVQEKRRYLVEQSKKQKAELLILTDRQQHQYNFQDNDYPALANNDPQNIPTHMQQQSTESSQRSYAQATLKQRKQDPQQNIEYTLSSFISKMDRRLENFSSRLSSQLCDIEKKIDVYADRQCQLEKIINEIILPSIQVLGRISSQSPKKRNGQEDFKAFNNKINEILLNQKHQPNYLNQQLITDHTVSPTTNVYHD